jgi:hypothetical protein
MSFYFIHLLLAGLFSEPSVLVLSNSPAFLIVVTPNIVHCPKVPALIDR